MDDTRGEIARLEGEIERLGDSLERCRKIALAAKISIAAGGVWLGALLLGLIWPGAGSLIGSTAAILGGIVAYGSNATTARQTEERIAEAEAERALLINDISLTLVPAERPTVH